MSSLSISQQEKIKHILNQCNICFDDFSQLKGMLIPRDIFLNNIEKYQNIKKDIILLKPFLSSSSLTALHKDTSNQKWPLLNIVRQILRKCNYRLKPLRKSDGYSSLGKKKYKRYFLIEYIKEIEC